MYRTAEGLRTPPGVPDVAPARPSSLHGPPLRFVRSQLVSWAIEFGTYPTVIPPEMTNHRADLVTQGFSQIKAAHGVGWDCLCHGLGQDFLAGPGQELFIPTLHALPDSIF